MFKKLKRKGFVMFGPFYIHSQYDWQPQWWYGRGRLEERTIRFPVGKKLSVEIRGKGKSYLELVDGPKYLKNTNWILDEFDSSFNDLAISSLKYHMHHSVARCADPEKFQGLIDRLSEEQPDMPHELMEFYLQDRITKKVGENFVRWETPETTPRIDQLREEYRQSELDYDERINKARHDFIDILPWLWS